MYKGGREVYKGGREVYKGGREKEENRVFIAKDDMHAYGWFCIPSPLVWKKKKDRGGP